jgi:murein DD-endopeptidase MepM/ murein hydrolase activator NlpD
MMDKTKNKQGSPSSDQSVKRPFRERLIIVFVNLLASALLLTAGYLAWDRYLRVQTPESSTSSDLAGIAAEPRPDSPKAVGAVALSPLSLDGQPASFSEGITRQIELDTRIPKRPQVNVVTYTVETGNSLFSIADEFGIKPETILWGNFETLQDNPHLIKPGQVLNILPTNGTFYQYHEGEDLSAIAAQFGVDAQDIIDYPGNPIDLAALSSGKPAIADGTWLIIPGGKRALVDWSPPTITRSNPASARYYGAGYCGTVYTGAVGSGTFVWPTTEHFISGYNYAPPVHPAIDIGGSLGNAIFATDSGVVVYAGWSDYGYGNLIVIDHGNGWQSAYAHLSGVGVGCGQSVYQGYLIGALGSTGNSSGPHLHFELSLNGAKLNPLDFLP